MKNNPFNGQIRRPPSWNLKLDHGSGECCGILWSWLVMEFGDYGTSPRFGWLEQSKTEYLTRIVKDFLLAIEEGDNDETS